MLEGGGCGLAGLELGLVEVGGDVLGLVALDRVGELDARDGHVAVVGDGDLVGDGVAQCVTLLGSLGGGLLLHVQARGRVVNRRVRAVGVVLVTGRGGVRALGGLRVLGVLRVVDRVGLGGHGVGVAAGQDVSLGDDMLGREALGLAHGQLLDGGLEAGVGILNLDIGVGNVAVVGDIDGVLDGLAQLVGLAIGRGVADLLVDGQRGVRALGRVLGGAGGARIGRVVRRVRALGRSLVLDGASQDILLGHFVTEGRGSGLARLELGLVKVLSDVLGLVADDGVGNGDVRDGHVASVGDGDLVLDRVAQCIALLGRLGGGLLLDAQGRLGILGRVLGGARRGLGVLALGALALGDGLVLHGASQDVGLGDGVLGLKVLACARSQALDGPLVAGQVVGDGDVCEGHVTGVLDGDLVGDLLAQSVGLAVGRRARGRLGHLKLAVDIGGVDGVVGGLGDLANLGGHGVLEAASQDVGLGDGVLSRGLDGLACRDVLERGLGERDALNLGESDGLRLVVDVRSRDVEGDGVAKLKLVALVGLGNDEVVVNRILARVGAIGHGQRAKDGLDGVVAVLRALVEGVGEGVLRLANERLGTGDGVGCAIALGPAVLRDSDLVVGQSLAVVDLGGVGGGQGDGARGNRERAINDDELDVGEVLADVDEVLGLELHLVGAGVGALDGSVALELEVVLGVERVGDAGDLVASHGLLGAVVLLGAGVLGDGDDHLVCELGHLEGALDRLDLIVVGLGALVEGVGERVLGAADLGLGAGHVVRGALGACEALAGDLDLVLGQRLAVVDLLGVGGGQGDGARGDRERAINDDELDVLEVGTVVGEVLGLELHLIGAGVGALDGVVAVEGEVLLGVERVGNLDVVAGDGLLDGVVLVLTRVLGDGDDNLVGELGHGQRALDLGDGVVGSLGALVEGVLELVGGAADCGLGAGHVVGSALALGEAVASDLDLVLGQSSAVVDLGGVRGGQGDGARADGQRAVDDDELDVLEVCVVVGEVAGLELHVVGAGVGALDGSVAVEGEVLLGVELVVNGDGVAGHGLLSAVVLLGAGVLGDGDGHLVGELGHGQRALRGGDGVVVSLGVVVQLVGEGVSRAANVGLGASHVVRGALALREALAANGDVLVGERGAVVDLLVGRGGQGNGTLRDLELAVSGADVELGGHVVLVSVPDHGGAGDGVGRGDDVGALGIGGLEALDGVLVATNLKLKSLEALGRLLGAVVDVAGVGVGLNGDLVLLGTVADGQLASGLGQAVVLGDVLALGVDNLEVVGVGAVVVSADQGALRRGVANGGLVALKEVGKGGLGCAVLFRAVVLGLLVRHGNCRHARVDGDGAVDVGDLKLGGDVLTLSVLNHQGVSRCLNGLSGHIGGSSRGLGLLKRVARGQRGDGDGGAVGLAVVGELAAGGGDHDCVSALGDGQGANGLGDGVVRFLGRVLVAIGSPGQLIGVLAAANRSLRTSGLEAEGLTIHDTGNRALSGQGSAIVDLGSSRRGDGNFLRVDRELAVNLGHTGEVGSLVSSRSVLDDVAVVNNVLSFVAHVGGRTGGSRFDSEALRQTGSGHGSVGKRLAVICLAFACCGKGHCCGVLGHLKLSELLSHGVVVGLRACPLDGVGVGGIANLSNGTSGLKRHGLTRDQAFDGSLILS